jgi:hypothetical protein
MIPKEHKQYAAPKQHREPICSMGKREDKANEDKYDTEAVTDLELINKIFERQMKNLCGEHKAL